METFIVRLWTTADPTEPVGEPVRGVVERVADGVSRTFTSPSVLIDFLRDRETPPTAPGLPPAGHTGDRGA